MGSMIVTSDTHLSAPDGRWPETTERFAEFLNHTRADPPDLIFVAGDVIDNLVPTPDGMAEGDVDHWKAEVEIYRSLKSRFTHTQFLQCLGIGHDYGTEISRTVAEKTIGSAFGTYVWNHHKLIWLDVPQVEFDNEATEHKHVMSGSEYDWLCHELSSSRAAILLFHVPLRTEHTFPAGVCYVTHNLTIDPRDPLYQIIGQHADKIAAVFNGHIHQFIQSSYCGIPVYLCPFRKDGYHCRISSDQDGLHIQPMHYP